MKKIALISILFLFPLICLHADIPGCYKVKGMDPNGQLYTGNLIIEKTGETFTGFWTYDNVLPPLVGTGIREDDQIAFIFRGADDPSSSVGIQIYQIKHNRLKGPWAFFGGTQLGFEIAKKINCTCP